MFWGKKARDESDHVDEGRKPTSAIAAAAAAAAAAAPAKAAARRPSVVSSNDKPEMRGAPTLSRPEIVRATLEPEPEAIPAQPSPGRRSSAMKHAEILDDLPPFSANISANLPEAARVQIALLQVSEKSVILILNSDNAVNSDNHGTARSWLRQNGWEVSDVYVVSPALFNELNTKDDEGSTLSDSDSERFFKEMLELGIKGEVSDLHVCVREVSSILLGRVHGRLGRLKRYTHQEAYSAVAVAYNSLAVPESRPKTEPAFNGNRQMYCTIEHTDASGDKWRIRYNTIKVEGGFDVVMRLLRHQNEKKWTLEEIGYENDQAEALKLAAQKTVGAIVVAGGTGSGKSTMVSTLMTMDPNRMSYKSYSVEDPVENRLFGVSQISVQRDVSDRNKESGESDFMAPIRGILRMDPDVIQFGEIRDKDSGDAFYQFVTSGHRCYSTVHATSAFDIVSRLSHTPIHMPRAVLSGRRFFSAMVYQALLPVVCPKCRKEAHEVEDLPEDYLAYIEHHFHVSTKNVRFANSSGCSNCKAGYIKQTVAAEVVIPTLEMRHAFLTGNEMEAEIAYRKTRTSGFDEADMTGKTAFEHGLYKVLQGIVDPRDLEAVFESFKTYEVIRTT